MALVKPNPLDPFGTGATTSTQIVGPIVNWINQQPLNVMEAAFGSADPTGAADSTTAFQAAHDAMTATRRVVYVPPGTYKVQGLNWTTSNSMLVGAGRGSSILKTSSGDLLNLGTAGTSLAAVTMMDLTLWSAAGGGDIIAPKPGTTKSINLSVFERLALQQDNDAKKIWSGANEGHIENTWRNCQFQHTLTGSVNPFYLIANSSANINANVWDSCRATWSGLHFYYLESAVNVAAFDNTFRNCNFEVTRGGNIKLLSFWNTSLDGCWSYDFGGTPASASYYYVGQSAAGGALASRHTTFRNIQRRDNNTLGGGVYDIELEASNHASMTYFENVDQGPPSGSSFLVNLNSNAGCIDRGSRGVVTAATNGPQYSNVPQDFIRLLSPFSAEAHPTLQMGTRLWLTGNNSPETVITAPIGSMYLRTNGGAATTFYVKESGTGNTGWIAK